MLFKYYLRFVNKEDTIVSLLGVFSEANLGVFSCEHFVSNI